MDIIRRLLLYLFCQLFYPQNISLHENECTAVEQSPGVRYTVPLVAKKRRLLIHPYLAELSLALRARLRTRRPTPADCM